MSECERCGKNFGDVPIPRHECLSMTEAEREFIRIGLAYCNAHPKNTAHLICYPMAEFVYAGHTLQAERAVKPAPRWRIVGGDLIADDVSVIHVKAPADDEARAVLAARIAAALNAAGK